MSNLSLFPPEIIQAAQDAQRAYPAVPACVTLAQWAIESAYGREIPPGSNNYFGIKAVRGQAFVMARTHEFIGGRMVSVSQPFARYPSATACFLAHARLLADSPIYADARAAGGEAGTDWRDFVAAMAKHYATAPNYATVIIHEIEDNALDLYDLSPEQPLVA